MGRRSHFAAGRPGQLRALPGAPGPAHRADRARLPGLDGHTPQDISTQSAPFSPAIWASSFDGNVAAFPVFTQVNGVFRVRILVHDLVNLTTWDGSAGAAADQDATNPILSATGDIVLYGVQVQADPDHINQILWRKPRTGSRQQVNQCVAPYANCFLPPERYDMSGDGTRMVYLMSGSGATDRPVPVLWNAGTRTNLMAGKEQGESGRQPIISSDGSTVAVWYEKVGGGQQIEGVAVAPVGGGPISEANLVVSDESDGFPLTSTYTPIDLSGDGKVVAYEFQEPNAADNGWLPTQSAAGAGR